MTYTFLKGAIQHGLFGLLSVIFRWSIMSGAISVTLVLVSVISTISVTSTITIDTLASTTPLEVLSSFPQYRYLNYTELLWAGLLLPVIIGGGLFTVVLAQGKGNEEIVDFYSDVASTTITVLGIAIILWIIGGTAYLIFYQAPLLNSEGSVWSQILANGTEGLKRMNMTVPKTTGDAIMVWLYPFFPIVALIAGYIHLFGNIHAGWIGGKWASRRLPI